MLHLVCSAVLHCTAVLLCCAALRRPGKQRLPAVPGRFPARQSNSCHPLLSFPVKQVQPDPLKVGIMHLKEQARTSDFFNIRLARFGC